MQPKPVLMKYRDHLLVNYSVKAESVAANIECIENILAELKAHPVADVYYAVYQMGSTSFIHVQWFPNEEVAKEVFQLPAFQCFFSQLESIVDEDPMAWDIEKIGAYNCF
jgi:hypothetical protein